MVYYYLAVQQPAARRSQHAAQFATKAASLPVVENFPNTITDAAVLMEAVQRILRMRMPDTLSATSSSRTRDTTKPPRYGPPRSIRNFEDPVLLRNLGIYRWHVKDDLEGAAT